MRWCSRSYSRRDGASQAGQAEPYTGIAEDTGNPLSRRTLNPPHERRAPPASPRRSRGRKAVNAAVEATREDTPLQQPRESPRDETSDLGSSGSLLVPTTAESRAGPVRTRWIPTNSGNSARLFEG